MILPICIVTIIVWGVFGYAFANSERFEEINFCIWFILGGPAVWVCTIWVIVSTLYGKIKRYIQRKRM